jgi:hypothetical protein
MVKKQGFYLKVNNKCSCLEAKMVISNRHFTVVSWSAAKHAFFIFRVVVKHAFWSCDPRTLKLTCAALEQAGCS